MAILSVGACRQEVSYPRELVMADSAYIHGTYDLADAALIVCGKLIDKDHQPTERYYQLVSLEKLYVHAQLNLSHLSMADSLCQYYDKIHDTKRYGQALLFRGSIYVTEGNMPEAMNDFLAAEDQFRQIGHQELSCLAARELGDVLFSQRMLSECVPYYRQYYALAKSCGDTLRMAYAANEMGMVNSIENLVDSAIYYYNESIRLARQISQSDILNVSRVNLCDIYIQTEQFDEARALLTSDPEDDANWGYLYLGEHRLDSAIACFGRMLGRYRWQGEVETLRMLARLEAERGRHQASQDYYERMVDATDSLREQLKAETTLKIKAQYDYSSLLQQRNQLELQNARQGHQLRLIIISLVALVAIAALAWLVVRQRRRARRARQAMLEQEQAERSRQSDEQVEKNNQRMKELDGLMDQARANNDTTAEERLQAESDALATDNQNIQAQRHRREAQLKELLRSDLYQHFKDPLTDKEARLPTDADWMMLESRVDEIYDNFTRRLMRLTPLSATEQHICLLLKLRFMPSDIAYLMCKTKAAITMARKRLAMKLDCGDQADALDIWLAEF